MNCSCINDIEKKLRDSLATKITGQVHSVECNAVALTLPQPGDNRMGLSVYIPFVVKADAPGYRSAKGKTVNAHASFCPFCGVYTKNQDGK